ncbi:MAG TPA: hypothetical protein VFH77_03080 [Streptomyces sp.]|nr:hypothetical protein [Streptomyces sp.]
MELPDMHKEDLVFVHEASAATGVPATVIRQWAARGRIHRFPGNHHKHGRGHFKRTMYALPEIAQLAKDYQATPQRAPKAA